MAETEQGRKKQTNVRLSPKTQEEISAMCSELNMTQAQLVEFMVETTKLKLKKEVLPNRLLEIENFEQLCKDVINAYVNSLDLYEKAESRIKEQFAKSLASKDKIIENQQEEIYKLKESKKEEDNKAKGLIKTCADAVKRADEATKLSNMAENLCAEKDRTIDAISEKLKNVEALLDQSAKETEKMRGDMQKQADDFSSQLDDAKKTANTAIKNCEEKDLKIEDLRKKLAEVSELTKNIDRFKAQIENDQEKIQELTAQIEEARHHA